MDTNKNSYRGRSGNFFDYDVKIIFSNLEDLDIKISTIAFILRVTEFEVWKMKTYQMSVPDRHKKKLENFLERLSPN